MAIDYSQRIPNNVDLSSDRRLQRALENWQPRFLDWWKDMGPDGAMNFDVCSSVKPVIVFAIARADSSGVSDAFGPPMSVFTQPGVSATTQMLRPRSSAAIARLTMFSAAFEVE